MADRFVQNIGDVSAQDTVIGGVRDSSASALLEAATGATVAVQRERVLSQAEQDVEAVNTELADNLSVLSQLRQRHRGTEGTPTEVAQARAEIEKLDAAVRQGLHRPEQAAIRKRAIIQRSISDAPLFAQELRGLVTSTGAGGGGAIADEQAAVLAGQDKAVRKKADELYGAGNWGVAEEEGIRERMRRDEDAADLINRSNIQAPKFRTGVMTLLNNSAHDILVKARQTFQARGALTQDVEDNYNIAINELERSALQQFRTYISQSDTSLTDEKVTSIEEDIKEEIQGYRDFTKGKRFAERLESYNKVKAHLDRAQSPLTDELLRVMNLGGESGGIALERMMFMSPQEQRQVAGMVDGGGSALLPRELRDDINARIVKGTEFAVGNVERIPPGWEKFATYINQQRVRGLYSRPDVTPEEAAADNSAPNLVDQLAKSTDVADLSGVVDFYKQAHNAKALAMNPEAKARAHTHAVNLTKGVLKQYVDAVNMPGANVRVGDDGTVTFLSSDPDPLSVGENTRPVLSDKINELFKLYELLGIDRSQLQTALVKRSAKLDVPTKEPRATGVIQRDTPSQDIVVPEQPLEGVAGELDQSSAVATAGVEQQTSIPRVEDDALEIQGELVQQKYGPKLVEEFTSDEGVRNSVYKDTKGNRTVGIGFNMDQSKSFRIMKDALGVDRNTFNGIKIGEVELSDDQVQALFSETLRIAERDIEKVIPNFDEHPDDVQRALLNFSFNQGLTKMRNTWKNTMRDIREMDYDSAASRLEASAWAKDVQAERRDRIIGTLRDAATAGDGEKAPSPVVDDVSRIKEAFPDTSLVEIKEFLDSQGG